jgi:periplasmic protein TonB
LRWDSPLVLATAGTIAIHLILIVTGDAIVVYRPMRPAPPAPHIEMVEVEVPPVLQPPPPPLPQPEPEPAKPAPPDPAPVRPQVRATPRSTPEPVAPPRAPDDLPPPTPTTTPDPGGEQVVHLDDVTPSATGVAVARGPRTSEKVGRGGSGGGTGAGAGSGAGVGGELPVPRSVATIKKRAMPRGDYSYFQAGKDYPPEARQLGIEGKILVRLVVDDTGKVRSTTILSKLGHGLDELALARAGQLQFDPAIDTDGNPVSSVVVWTFDMTLPK